MKTTITSSIYIAQHLYSELHSVKSELNQSALPNGTVDRISFAVGSSAFAELSFPEKQLLILCYDGRTNTIAINELTPGKGNNDRLPTLSVAHTQPVWLEAIRMCAAFRVLSPWCLSLFQHFIRIRLSICVVFPFYTLSV